MEQGFSLALAQFLLQSKQHLYAVSHELDITAQQAMTLLMIDNSMPRPMGGYCKLYDCDASNLTGIVDGLEAKGLITRQPHPQDRRVKTLQLEPKGEKLKSLLIEKLDASYADFLQCLSPQELTQFTSTILKLNTAAELHCPNRNR